MGICNKQSLFLGLTFFLYLFNITVAKINISGAELVLAGCLVALLVDTRVRIHVLRIFASNYLLIVVLLLIGLYGTLLSFIWGNAESIWLEIFIKNCVIFLTALVLGYYLKKINNSNSKNNIEFGLVYFLDLCFYVLSLQAIFVVLSFLSPGIREFFSSIVVNRGNIDIDHLFRFRGLHDSGGFTLSSFLGIGAVYGVYSFMHRRNNLAWVYIFLSFILLLAVSLVGRTGFLVVALGITILAIRRPIKMLWVILSVYVFALILLLLASKLVVEQYNFFTSIVFDYAFEFVVNFQKGQGFRTDSSDDLKTMLFLPDVWNILFGNGSFDKGYAGIRQTDSGYMKTLLASGLLGFITVYGVFLFIAISVFSSLKPYKNLRYFVLIVFVSMFVIEIKGPVFYQNDVSRFFWLLYGTVLAYARPVVKLI